jgi:hypothetical protein
MQQRGLFWPDIVAVIDDPEDIHSPGLDDYNRPKWIIRGNAGVGDDIEIVCAIELDESGAEFIRFTGRIDGISTAEKMAARGGFALCFAD